MIRIPALFITSFFIISGLQAQTATDSGLIKNDTAVLNNRAIQKDSVVKRRHVKKDSLNYKKDSSIPIFRDDSIGPKKVVEQYEILVPDIFRKTLLLTPFFNFYGEVQSEDISEYRPSSKDSLFYLILGLWFYFALIRLFFSKYLDNIFALFFRATMRQQQIREQALQMPLPSLLLNILFALSTGLFATFLVRYYYDPAKTTEFWALYLYCVIAVAVVYIVKFLIFKLLGWIFNIKKATGNYLFVVFLVNKMMGICLLPFLMFIAFSGSGTVDVAIAISFLMIAVFFLYRYITCFGTVAAEIKLTVFHYFLYLCAFEIAPLLLMYKVVFSFFEKAF